MDKEALRKRRDAPVSIKLGLEDGDAVVKAIGRDSGLFFITQHRILRTRSPDQIDPDLRHPDAPWEQSIVMPIGASHPLVARTVLQTEMLASQFFGQQSEAYNSLMEIGWEVLNSLVSLRVTKDRLEKQISSIVKTIELDLKKFTEGFSPPPLPIVEYYDVEFRSFVNEVRRCLSTISELFIALIGEDFGKGHFHSALEWARAKFGEEHVLTRMLENDQRWICLWIDMRIALEHPKKHCYIETLNFSLEADRNIRLPTWRFVHPDYDMGRPQNLLEVFEFCINNLLKFYEDLQVLLIEESSNNKLLSMDIIPEDERNPKCPVRIRTVFTGMPIEVKVSE